MAIDEVAAFRNATHAAQSRGWPWQPPYWIDLVNGEWEVQAEGAYVLRVDGTTGEIVSAQSLDPLVALEVARHHVQEEGLSWRPGFSIQLDGSVLLIGACQSQFGGNITVRVDHQGKIVGLFINPK